MAGKKEADQINDNNPKSKKKPGKKQGKSDRSHYHTTDVFKVEKSVGLYVQDKPIEELEKDFEYKSDEESVFNSF